MNAMQMKEMNVNELYPKWLIANEKGRPIKLIDVREPHEYAAGHVPGAELVPLRSVPARVDAFPQDGEVFVICRSGGRSAQAIQFLRQQQGHDNLINIAGGTMAWAQAGYPIDQEA